MTAFPSAAFLVAMQARANDRNRTQVAWLYEGVWSVADAVHPHAPVCPELVVYPEGKVAA